MENGALLGRRRHLRRLLNFVQHVYRLRSLRHEHLLLVHAWYDVDLVLELRLHEKLLSFFFRGRRFLQLVFLLELLLSGVQVRLFLHLDVLGVGQVMRVLLLGLVGALVLILAEDLHVAR